MPPRRRTISSAALIAALVTGYCAAYLLNLDTFPLARMDEFRYSEIPREMLASDNWVVPRLNGLRYFEKPVLGYWVGAASLALFGENNFASRLPSALATGMTAFFIGLLGARLSPNRGTGILAAFIYLTALAVFGIGTINILDSLLTLWLTMTIGGYLWAWRESNERLRRILKITAGVACGLAFLTKGFLALVVPVIVVVPFLAWQRQWKELFTGLWLPFGVAFIVALPWALLIYQQEPDFWRYFFWEEHIRRFAADDAQHPRPIWFFFATLPAMALPWTFMVPAALPGLRRQAGNRGSVGYLVLWAVIPFLFFSVARGKLLPYILPCFPPLALLLAIGLRESLPEAAAARGRAGLRGLLWLWIAGLAFLLLNQFAGLGKPVFDATEGIRWGALVAAMATGVAICIVALRTAAGRLHVHVLAAGLAVVPLILAIPFAMPNRTRMSKMPGPILSQLAADVPADAVLISDGGFVHAVAWIFKRNDIYLLSPGELRYGVSYPEDQFRLLTAAGLRQLLDRSAGRRAVFIACDAAEEPMLRSVLAASARQLKYGDMVVWETAAKR